MGRGWRNAQRRSEDVTERVLGRASAMGRRGRSGRSARAACRWGAGARSRAGAPDLALLADSLGLELLALLDDGPVAPVARVAAGVRSGLATRRLAEALALADRAVRSLLGRGLVVLQSESGDRGRERSPPSSARRRSRRRRLGRGGAASRRDHPQRLSAAALDSRLPWWA